MQINLKKFSIFTISTLSLLSIPVIAQANIQCPDGWAKEMHGVAEVCVAQNQNQNQAQIQNNNQSQNVNQNVNVAGGSSSSSSSSSSDSNITINNPTPTPTPTTTTTTYYVQGTPQVVYQTPTKVVQLPATGLPETALALSGLLPVGLILKKIGFKKSVKVVSNSASSIWAERNF